MITIRANPYTREEKNALINVMKEARSYLRLKYCPDHAGACSTCPYRHLCYDLDRVIEFSEEGQK